MKRARKDRTALRHPHHVRSIWDDQVCGYEGPLPETDYDLMDRWGELARYLTKDELLVLRTWQWLVVWRSPEIFKQKCQENEILLIEIAERLRMKIKDVTKIRREVATAIKEGCEHRNEYARKLRIRNLEFNEDTGDVREVTKGRPQSFYSILMGKLHAPLLDEYQRKTGDRQTKYPLPVRRKIAALLIGILPGDLLKTDARSIMYETISHAGVYERKNVTSEKVCLPGLEGKKSL